MMSAEGRRDELGGQRSGEIQLLDGQISWSRFEFFSAGIRQNNELKRDLGSK